MVGILIAGWHCIEMIGNEIERNAGLVIFGIEKIFELLRMCRRLGQGQAYELGLGRDLADGRDYAS